jgi:hypothetical protein
MKFGQAAREFECKAIPSLTINSKESILQAMYITLLDGTTNKAILPARQASGIDSMESVPELLKRLGFGFLS